MKVKNLIDIIFKEEKMMNFIRFNAKLDCREIQHISQTVHDKNVKISKAFYLILLVEKLLIFKLIFKRMNLEL